MTEKLLPCPFCGSSNLEDAEVGAEYVSCLDCGAFGPSSGVDHTFQREIRLSEARNKWNDRPAQPEIQAIKLMADCMDMVRQELIEAGIIKETVPPMMVANAVLTEIQALRGIANEYDDLARHMSAGGDFHEFQRDRAEMEHQK